MSQVFDPALSKIYAFRTDEFDNRLDNMRAAGDKITVVNGCFDLLHAGHLHLLLSAKAMAPLSRLLVALNYDSTIRLLKGPYRPIVRYEHRALMLAALSVVDLVVGFNELTPEELLHRVLPELLVKGGEYRNETIPGASSCAAIRFVPMYAVDYGSTSALVRRAFRCEAAKHVQSLLGGE